MAYDILDDVLKVLDWSVPLESFNKEIFTPYLCFINTRTAQLLHASSSQLYDYYANQSETCRANEPEFKAIRFFVDNAENYWEKADYEMKDAFIAKILDIINKAIKYHKLESNIQFAKVDYDVAWAILGVLDGYQHTYRIKPFVIFKSENQSCFIAENKKQTDFFGRVMFHRIY